MKKRTKLLIIIAFMVAIGASFFVGSHTKQQELSEDRMERCLSFITFAIDKVESEDLSDPAVEKSLISNVYAAYIFCDSPHLSGQLHDLWNRLISGDDAANEEDMLLAELKNIAEALGLEQDL